MTRQIIELTDRYRKSILPHIVIVGCGGTGGYVAQQVAQAVSIFQSYGRLILADYDTVEEKNLRNQLFIKKDIGKNKSEVLAERYRAAYQIQIGSYSESYVEDATSLQNIFFSDYMSNPKYGTYLPILISCVDNNFSRKVFHEYFQSQNNLLYIDVGNEAAIVPDDYMTRPFDQWTEEEKKTFKNSGYTGQLVAGLRLGGKTVQDPVAEVFPDILEDQDDIAPSRLSCSDLVVSHPQKLITNRYSAMCVSTVINEILDNSTLSIHKILFHAQRGFMKSE
ncbi:ThiF family adenylyltransferase [Bacillus swezeyi]|uniref:Thiamine biosynthesis protein ThiF n=1 Tax=Bacillus swezeyi TaxID=1925020 RepID=A0A5M8RJH9_9BACI|nr:ThiF family adenylyltransferase [Bacillus swezeyi]KAA6447004.1 thiamine biosynthesis protein ThiF [Bacillus swezeyi]KAA6471572.1 thiamine biosynthesis protein ThiF [Bacillus swezeyi]